MKFQDIYKTYEKFIEYAVSKTDLATKDHDIHNIKESGGMTEEIIRNFFAQFMPKRYAITSGYIIKSNNKIDDPIISDQLDMIIVDTLVPHSFYNLDDKASVQVVPWECVVGVFEIKRTLTKNSFEDAVFVFEKLNKIFSKNDDTKYLPGGIEIKKTNEKIYLNLDASPLNPIFGILSLKHDDGFNIDTEIKESRELSFSLAKFKPGLFKKLKSQFDKNDVLYKKLTEATKNKKEKNEDQKNKIPDYKKLRFNIAERRNLQEKYEGLINNKESKERAEILEPSKIDIVFSLSGLMCATLATEISALSKFSHDTALQLKELIKLNTGEPIQEIIKKLDEAEKNETSYERLKFSKRQVTIIEHILKNNNRDDLIKILINSWPFSFHSPYQEESEYCVLNNKKDKLKIISAGIGYIQGVTQCLNGRMSNIENLFFNKSIFKDIKP